MDILQASMPPLTVDWLHLIILLGAVQGVIIAAALAARRRNRTANRLLSTLMIAFALFMASGVYHSARLETAFPHFFGFGYPTPFLFGPLVYLYAVAAADRSWRMRYRDWLHFLPFVIVVVGALPIYLLGAQEKLDAMRRVLAGETTFLMKIETPFRYVSGLGYGLATMVFLRKHGAAIEHSYSSTERVNLRWLLWLGASAVGIWVMATAFTITNFDRADDIISLAVAALVCAVGYMGLRQPEILRFETAEFPVVRLPAQGVQPESIPADAAVAGVEAVDGTDGAARYERSGLSPAEAKRIKTRLLGAMDADRPWADSELTLADLAEKLGTTPHKLSEVLNAEIGETFYDFVNGYRVREVQRRIGAGEARTRRMLSVAMDAGFASKSTFNQVFKKHTGQTPSDFRQTAGS
jgi:AraC-like DNA-binding protein